MSFWEQFVRNFANLKNLGVSMRIIKNHNGSISINKSLRMPSIMLGSLFVVVGCGVPSNDEADSLDPAGVEVGNALRAAFPTFDPANPTPVAGFDVDLPLENISEVSSSAEIETTVGIDRWRFGRYQESTSKDTYVEGFIGSVRVAAFRLQTTSHLDTENTPAVTDIETSLAFHGHASSRITLANGVPTEGTPDTLETALVPVIDYDLARVNENALTGLDSLQNLLRCVHARNTLISAQSNASRICAFGNTPACQSARNSLRVARDRVNQYCS